MATIDECLERVPPNVRLAIEQVAERAGTYDADWSVLLAAGELLANSRSFMIDADSELSAIAHGRPPSDKAKLLRISDGLRQSCK